MTWDRATLQRGSPGHRIENDQAVGKPRYRASMLKWQCTTSRPGLETYRPRSDVAEELAFGGSLSVQGVADIDSLTGQLSPCLKSQLSAGRLGRDVRARLSGYSIACVSTLRTSTGMGSSRSRNLRTASVERTDILSNGIKRGVGGDS